MVVCVFIDGEVGMMGLQICECFVMCGDIDFFFIFEDVCKDLVVWVDYLNMLDIVILCLLDVVVCESVVFIENDMMRVIDVFSVYWVVEGWDYGFVEMDVDQVDMIVVFMWVFNLGCWL